MSANDVIKYIPSDWTCGINSKEVELIDIPRSSSLYNSLSTKIDGIHHNRIHKIERVENTHLYGQFLLCKAEYESRGPVRVLELFHDTGESNIGSIVGDNLDRRLVRRAKYGKGVSFSPSSQYANLQSSRNNGIHRAMIVADVLVGEFEYVESCSVLPSKGLDTTIGNYGKVYVKYYDDEFYPKYIIYYRNM